MKKQEHCKSDEHTISRREFLKASAATGGGAAMLGGFPWPQTAVAGTEGAVDQESLIESFLAEGTGDIFYVDAVDGDDSLHGRTVYGPFKTIQHAIDQASPGSMICVRDGIYNELIRVKKEKAGTAKNPTIITAYPGERPVIDGRAGAEGINTGLPADWEEKESPDNYANSRYKAEYSFEGLVRIESSHVLFQGFKITRSLGVGLAVGREDWNNVNSIKGVIVRDCEICNSRYGGVRLRNCKDLDGYDTAGCIVEGCNIHRNGNFAPYPREGEPEQNWPGALNIDDCERITVQRTKIHENWGEGLVADSSANGAKYIDIVDCEFYDNYRAQIYLHAVTNARVQRNLIYHTKNPEFPFSEAFPSRGAGINIAPAEPQYEHRKEKKLITTNVEVINNVLVGNGWNIKLSKRPSKSGTVKDIKIINNTLVNAIKNNKDQEPVSIYDEQPNYDGKRELKNNLVLQTEGKTQSGPLKGWDCSHNGWSSAPDIGHKEGDFIGTLALVMSDAPLQRGCVDPAWYGIASATAPGVDGAVPWTSSEKSVWSDVDFFCRKRDTTQPDKGAFEYGKSAWPWRDWKRISLPSHYFSAIVLGQNAKFTWDYTKKKFEDPRESHLELLGIALDNSLWRSFQRVPGNWNQEWWWLDREQYESLATGENKDGTLSLFAIREDGNVQHFSQTRPAVDPIPKGRIWYYCKWGVNSNSFPSSFGPFMSLTVGKNKDGRLEVFGVKKDGTPWHTWQRESGWSDWVLFHSEDQQFKKLFAAQNKDGRQEIFGLAADGSAWHTWQRQPNRGWTVWRRLHGRDDKFANLAVGRNENGKLEVFGIKEDGTPWHTWQRWDPEKSWSDWVPFHSEVQQFKTFVVGTNHDGRLEVFGLDKYGSAYHTYQKRPNRDWHPWERLHTRRDRFVELAVRPNIRYIKTDIIKSIDLDGDGEKEGYTGKERILKNGLEVIGLKKDGLLWQTSWLGEGTQSEAMTREAV